MPDLPLPKPQPPQPLPQVSPATGVAPSAPTPRPQGVSSPTPPPPPSTAISDTPPKTPYSPVKLTPAPPPASQPASQPASNPSGSLQEPSVAPPIKPPAVVTALSSVSSHQIPSQAKTDADEPLPASAMHATAVLPVGSTAVPQSLTAPAEALPAASAVVAPTPSTSPVQSVAKPLDQSQPIVPVQTSPVPLKPTVQGAPQSSPATPLSPPPASKPVTASNPAPPSSPSPASPVIATPKKSKKGLIFLIVGILVGLFILGGVGMLLFSKPSTQSAGTDSSAGGTGAGQGGGTTTVATSPSPAAIETTLEYWGLWEPSEVLAGVLSDFQAQNPTIAVRYVQQSYKDYRERLQTAVASGNGPDLFRYHASWVPMLKTELEPLPSSVMSPSEFAQTFYPVASKQLQQDGQLVGIPLMYDGLVLYYNQDILETAGIQPPKTWSELRDAARNLKIPKTGTPLQRGGLAIGTAENVDHFADIIAVLMLQNGADLQQPNSPEGRDALLFYTNFASQDQVWSADLPPSTVAFARGDVAMMFAPSWRAFEIAQQNPNLRFATVPLPQLPNTKVTWGTYWAEGVSKQSKSKDAAWKLLKYLSSKEVQQKLYTSQAQVRAFGEPYSRVDLADQLASNKIVGPILQDAPNALGWYMSTFTHDNGINDQIITYYKDAVNSLLKGSSTDQVLQSLQLGVNQVLGTYGVIAPVAPTEAPKTY